ncbi:MAG: hypothetical protein KDA33_15800 [Phycisphaerales bacterium]|nr:hypothetical protein [Phycisphaerales bacterium]
MSFRNQSNVWPLRLVAGSIVSACVALSVFAQPVETPLPKTERVDRIERLVSNGQLSMGDAVRMAEARTEGVACNARCAVRVGPAPVGTGADLASGEPAPTDERLMYEIVCVKEGRTTRVSIDGKLKKVVSPPSPKPAPEGEPDKETPRS